MQSLKKEKLNEQIIEFIKMRNIHSLRSFYLLPSSKLAKWSECFENESTGVKNKIFLMKIEINSMDIMFYFF